MYFCFTDYAKAFDCVDHNKLWKILREMGIPNHLTWLLRNLYAGQETPVRTGHGTTHWFQIGKGVCQGCILSPCLFTLYAEYIMWTGMLDEVQAGIKIAWSNINNLRYADDTILMVESEEELKSFLMRVKEESEKTGLKLNMKKLWREAVLRWRRNRTGRPLSPSQIPQKNISTLSKLHKTTSEGWQRTSGNQKSRPLSSKTVNLSGCPSMWRNFSSLP